MSRTVSNILYCLLIVFDINPLQPELQKQTDHKRKAWRTLTRNYEELSQPNADAPPIGLLARVLPAADHEPSPDLKLAVRLGVG